MNKTEQRAYSTIALKKLLICAISEPAQFQDKTEFIEVLKVQGKLAKWQDDTLGIKPCSLNTLKTSAEGLFDNGYQTLDELRQNAILAFEQHFERKKASNKTTKVGLQKKVRELELKNSILEQQNRILVDLLVNMKEKTVGYASDGSDLTIALCEREMRRLSAKVGFSGNIELFSALEKKADEEAVKKVSSISENPNVCEKTI